ncbi:MAG: tetratricopeptide repeat protein [Nitrospirota bacterium]|nr:tetratricopeptide repeat protein [Nitrospirota bacterium]
MLTNRIKPEYIVSFIFLLSIFLLAIFKIQDTDAWLHLSLGREIFNLGGLPSSEPFTYPSFEKPFLYTSWLFGLLLYIAALLFGLSGVILFKAFTVTAAFYILLRDSLSPYKNSVVAIGVLIAVALFCRFRFVERPDIFLMVFLGATIYFLNAFQLKNKKVIYALPFVHLLWANSHSSIVLMPVPYLSFIAGGAIQLYLNKKNYLSSEGPSFAQIKTVSIIFLVSLAAIFITPDPLQQFTYGQSVMSSAWYKENITELAPMIIWERNSLFAGVLFLVASFVLNRKRVSLFHVMLVIPFILLPFSARRFHFLFGIVAAPVFIKNISAYIAHSERLQKLSSSIFSKAFVSASVVLCTFLALAQVKPLGNEDWIFGFGVNDNSVPEGAIQYMDKRNITGRVFNTFEWGPYIIWRSSDKRRVYIDARGYLSEDLLEKYSRARTGHTRALDELHAAYGFEAIILDFPLQEDRLMTNPEKDIVLSHPEWALVYWDDNSLVYLKRNGRYSAVIQAEEYKTIKPASQRDGIKAYLHDDTVRALLEADLQRNMRETGSFSGQLLLGYLYNHTGRYTEALNSFSRVKETSTQKRYLILAYSGMGLAYSRLGDPDKSIYHYGKSFDLSKDAAMLYNIAAVYLDKKDKAEAIKYLGRAIALNRKLMPAYSLLISTYESLGMHDMAQEVLGEQQKAGNYNNSNPQGKAE